jgi:hypothetical protein
VKSKVERRNFKRFSHIAVIAFETEPTNGFSYGLLKNMSEDGICFETDGSMEPGTLINGSVDGLPYRSAKKQFSASVKWCHANGENNAVHPYEIGLKLL